MNARKLISAAIFALAFYGECFATDLDSIVSGEAFGDPRDS